MYRPPQALADYREPTARTPPLLYIWSLLFLLRDPKWRRWVEMRINNNDAQNPPART